jgi:hypothetical protein
MDKNLLRVVMVVSLTVASFAVLAGEVPGNSSTWNGPWGGGYLQGAPYSPMANPYVSAGYPVSQPYGSAPDTNQQPYVNNAPAPVQQAQYLPGGGFILPPGEGGGMIPGAYSK